MARPKTINTGSNAKKWAADLRAEAIRLQEEAKTLLRAANVLDAELPKAWEPVRQENAA